MSDHELENSKSSDSVSIKIRTLKVTNPALIGHLKAAKVPTDTTFPNPRRHLGIVATYPDTQIGKLPL